MSGVQDQPCQYMPSGMAAQCSGYEEVPLGDEQALGAALYKVGPIAVGIDASLTSFQFYSKGQWADMKWQIHFNCEYCWISHF